MAHIINMPKQGLQMTEGTIMKWLASEGDTIAENAPLFEIETDKLTITVDSTHAGTLLKIVRKEGEVVPITEAVAIIGDANEDISEVLASMNTGASQTQETQATQATQESTSATASASQAPMQASLQVSQGAQTSGFASPRAKTAAQEKNLDYSTIAGSGPDGLVIERDVLATASAQPSATPLAKKIAAQQNVSLANVHGSGARGKICRADVLAGKNIQEATPDIRPLTGMRRVISQRMKESQNLNAQTTHRVSVCMTEASRCREQLKKLDIKVSFNDIISLCVARALHDKPQMNVQFVENGIWYKDTVNLGIAVALDEGLVVPVVHNAQYMTLQEISVAIKEVATKARDGSLEPDRYTGGSFTISNLGMYGLEEFTAIINPPESGILAVGKIEQTPIAVNGNVEIHPMMKLTLSYDHRLIDGAPAAEFLSTIKKYLENPFCLL